MTRNTFRLALLGAACAAGLAACKDDDRQSARIAAPDPGPLGYVADAAAPGYGPPAPVQPYRADVAYGWAERAYDEQRRFYDAPPAYSFDYGDTDALVWRTDDDWSMYAEPWDQGYRYYYYEPGAAYPYFVRDEDYGYGYDPSGVLVAVFDAAGAYLAADRYSRFAPDAGRYWARGHDLRSAGMRAPRIAVDERTWATRAPLITRSAESWLRAGERQRNWTTWRSQGGQARFQNARAFAAPAFAGPAFGGREDHRAFQDERKFVHEEAKAERKADHAFAKEDRAFAKADRALAKADRHGWADARRELPARAFERPSFAEAHGRAAAAVEPFRGSPGRSGEEGRHGRPAEGGGGPRFAAQDAGFGHGHGGGNPHRSEAAPAGPPQGGPPQSGGGSDNGHGHGGGNPHGGGDQGGGGDHGDKGGGHGHGKKG
jgi:hypothetical protein